MRPRVAYDRLAWQERLVAERGEEMAGGGASKAVHRKGEGGGWMDAGGVGGAQQVLGDG